jgi:hypothetical protein
MWKRKESYDVSAEIESQNMRIWNFHVSDPALACRGPIDVQNLLYHMRGTCTGSRALAAVPELLPEDSFPGHSSQ